MTELKVDPIEYAWERCNQGARLPEALTKTSGAPLTYTLSSALMMSSTADEVAAVRAAIRSRILGSRRRVPRRLKPRDFS